MTLRTVCSWGTCMWDADGGDRITYSTMVYVNVIFTGKTSLALEKVGCFFWNKSLKLIVERFS